jgi:hypothetical protein
MSKSFPAMECSSNHRHELLGPHRIGIVGVSGVTLFVLAVGFSGARSDSAWRGDEPQGSPRVAEAVPAEPSVIALDASVTLQRLHHRIVLITDQALPPREPSGQQQIDSVIEQRIAVKYAESNFENAKLSREVAEIAIVEYVEGIFPQDAVLAETELHMAKNRRENSALMVESAQEQLDKIKKASKGSPQDRAHLYVAQDRVTDTEVGQKKSEHPLQQAEFKLKLLVEHVKPRRIKEVQASQAQNLEDEAQTEQLERRVRNAVSR